MTSTAHPGTGPAFGPGSAHLVALESVLTRLEAAERRIRQAEAERVRLLAEAFDVAAAESDSRISFVPLGAPAELAYRAVRAEVAACLHESEHTAERRMSHAVALTRDYRRVFDAYETGLVSERHATVITDAGSVIGAGSAPVTVFRRAAYEEAVLAVAIEETPARLRPIARRLAEQYAETTLDERHEEARRRRRVYVVDGEDGMADLVAHLPAAEAHGIHRRLTRMSRELEQRPHERPQDQPGGAASADPAPRRTRDEVRADLLAGLLLAGEPDDEASESGLAAIRAEIQVVIDGERLLGLIPPEPQDPTDDGFGPVPAPAALTGYGPIDTSTARRLAGSALHWELIRRHSGTGEILTVDRYRPSEQMRRHLAARDEHCRFPGCRVPADRCDIDHTVDAAHGGATSTDNLAHLCRGHHTLKHHTGWRVGQSGSGDLDWASPTGRRYRERPASRVAFLPIGTRSSPPPENASRATTR